MKTVLVTTTIHVPEVLRKYRELGPDVRFVVAGDRKSPHQEILDLLNQLGGYVYLTPEEQEDRYPALSETIGWNSIQRRNIAILEAAKLEPDVVVSIDDDNWPKGDYFREIEESFRPFKGLMAEGPWFNVGELAHDRFTYRGFPRSVRSRAVYSLNGRPHEIGVVNGLIFGDPDTNAWERKHFSPEVKSYGIAAVALDPSETWSPINSQNTAYRAELAPLMMVLPRVGRYDDIWGSFIAQAVLQGTGYHVLFGKPYVDQRRNEHDLAKDIEDEGFGRLCTPDVVDFLRGLELPAGDVLTRLRAVVEALEGFSVPFPSDFLQTWCEAWESL